MTQFIQIEELHRRPPQPGRIALWDLGFRPFYLLASIYAALSVVLWALHYGGLLPWLTTAALPGPLGHAHEMLFGFAAAVIVGFLFTAGRNWSGHPTPTGGRLAALAGLWLLARVLAWTPWTLAAGTANAAFLTAAAWGLAQALLRSANRRNHFFIVLLLALATASAAIHLAAGAAADHPHAQWLPAWMALPTHRLMQVGLDVVLFIMVVMSGRVVPMFTNNAIRAAGATRHTALDRMALGATLAVLALDAARVIGSVGHVNGVSVGTHGADSSLALLCGACAAAHAARWALWKPWRTLRHPLVWVLHLAMLWVPVHLALRAAGALGWMAPALATHALTVGAMGLLIIGMMTRTTRGHTGAPLLADRWDVAAYTLVAAAGLLRVGVPLVWPQHGLVAVQLAAAAWAAGFAVYAWRYAPALWRPRQDGLPG